MIRWFLLGVVLLFPIFSSAYALEVAPRLTDREIIESLAKLQQGQLNADKRFDDVNRRFDDVNRRIDDLRTDFNKRFDDVNARLDTSHQTMLALFGALVTLIVALFAYIAWDRRTLVKPLQDKLNLLEHHSLQETQRLQENSSHLKNLLDALRQLAQEDKKLASVLHSFSLL